MYSLYVKSYLKVLCFLFMKQNHLNLRYNHVKTFLKNNNAIES